MVLCVKKKSINFAAPFRRVGRVVECGGLENRFPVTTGTRVRIPYSPPVPAEAEHWAVSKCSEGGLFFLNEPPSFLNISDFARSGGQGQNNLLFFSPGEKIKKIWCYQPTCLPTPDLISLTLRRSSQIFGPPHFKNAPHFSVTVTLFPGFVDDASMLTGAS